MRTRRVRYREALCSAKTLVLSYILVGGTIESGENLKEMINLALKYSAHRLKSKNLIAMLTRSERFIQDENFSALNPVYNISPKEIEQRLIAILTTEESNK